MARTQRPLSFNLLFFFFPTIVLFFSLSTPISLVHSLRPHTEKDQHFQVLDVSASLKKTLQVFSNQKPQPPTITATTTTSSSSALSFSLHPRDSIIRPKYESYSELITSRLEADLARSNFIHFQLQRALSKSKNKTNMIRDLESPLTLAIAAGGYAARVGVGQPVKEFHLLADTGSDVNWLQCKPCKCYPQSDPIFNPSKSTSYRPLSCQSQQCNSLSIRSCAKSHTCLYNVTYGDMSTSFGDFATETLSFGNSGSVKNVAIGCGRVSRGIFGGLAGIIGLGGSATALPSQIKAKSFSYCLPDMDSSSSSTLEFNSSPPRDSVLVPLIKNPKFDVYYYVELTGIIVEDELVSIPASVYKIGKDGNGGFIVDSGTSVTRLKTRVYNKVRDAFVKHTRNLTLSSGFRNLDTCYDHLSSSSRFSIPEISFQFSGGKTLSLPPENYFIPVNYTSGKFCLGFAGTNLTVSIIGSTQQKGFRVNYDLANKLIGFSPNKC